MKIAILIGAASAVRFIDNQQELYNMEATGSYENYLAQQRGIDEEDLIPPRHWAGDWPHGVVDDGTNDEDVMKAEKGPGMLKPIEVQAKYLHHPSSAPIEDYMKPDGTYDHGAITRSKLDNGADDEKVLN